LDLVGDVAWVGDGPPAEASCTYTVTDGVGMEMLSGGFELLVARGHARDLRMRRLFPATPHGIPARAEVVCLQPF
jgi:hypothetical protein